MVQPCPECRQTRRHKLSCGVPKRAPRRGDGTVSTTDTVDTYNPATDYDSGVSYGTCDSGGSTSSDTGTCGGE